MKKTFKHGSKSLTVEVHKKAKVDIQTGWKKNPKEGEPDLPVFEKQEKNVVIGLIDGKEVARRIVNLEDPDLVVHADGVERELLQIAGKGKATHDNALSAKGYK